MVPGHREGDTNFQFGEPSGKKKSWYESLLELIDSLRNLATREFHSADDHAEQDQIAKRLNASGVITGGELENAKKLKDRSGKFLGRILVEEGLLTEAQFAQALAYVRAIPYVELDQFLSDREALDCIPEPRASDQRIVPLYLRGDTMTVMICHNSHMYRLAELEVLAEKKFELVMAENFDFEYIERRYRGDYKVQSEGGSAT